MDTGNYIDVSTYTDLSDEHLLQTFLPSSEEDMISFQSHCDKQKFASG